MNGDRIGYEKETIACIATSRDTTVQQLDWRADLIDLCLSEVRLP